MYGGPTEQVRPVPEQPIYFTPLGQMMNQYLNGPTELNKDTLMLGLPRDLAYLSTFPEICLDSLGL